MRRKKTGVKQLRIALTVYLAVLTAAGGYTDTGMVCMDAQAEELDELIEDQEEDLLIIEEETDSAIHENSLEEPVNENTEIVIEAILEEPANENPGTMMDSKQEKNDAGSQAGGSPLEEMSEVLPNGTGDSSDIPEKESDTHADTGEEETEIQPDTGKEKTEIQPDTGEEETESHADTGEEETETHADTGQEKTDTEREDTKVYLGIDNRHIYEGMEQSFSEGYRPTVKDGSLELVIPYVASGKLKGDKLTVNLEFGSQQELPFEPKNYLRDVTKKEYIQVNGVMREISENTVKTEETEDREEVYLYECSIPIRESAAPGQYSLTVHAEGYTETMNPVSLDYQIFFLIPEPEAESGTEDGKENESEGVSDGSSYVESGGGYAGSSGGDTSEELIRQPKMLLESCSLSGKNLEAGSTEELQVSLQNRSSSQSMYNLKVVLQTESQSLNLERNSFYYEKVDPGEIICLDEKVEIAVDAEAGVVPLTFSFEYEDKKGASATGTEMVNLTVVQPVKMELEKAEIPAYVYASDTIEITMSVLNLSRTEVYNARIHLEGTGLFPTRDVFIGNMEAGSGQEGSMKIYVGTKTMETIGVDNGTDDTAKYGAVSGTITLSYEDAAGETHEVSQDYQTEIKKAQILSLAVEDEQESGNPWWISVFAVLLLGMSAMILLLWTRLRRKNVLLEEVRNT